MGLETRKATSFVELLEMRALLRAHILPVTTNTPNDPTKDEKKTIYLRSTKEINQSIIVATISCSGNCGSKWGRMSLINHYSEINWRILEDLNRTSFCLWFFINFFPFLRKRRTKITLVLNDDFLLPRPKFERSGIIIFKVAKVIIIVELIK